MQPSIVSNPSPRGSVSEEKYFAENACSVSEESDSSETTQNPKTSLRSTVFNCGYEFVRSLDPGYGYHYQDRSHNQDHVCDSHNQAHNRHNQVHNSHNQAQGCGVQFHFEPVEFAKSVICAFSPIAKFIINGVEFFRDHKLLAVPLVPLVMMKQVAGCGANPVSQDPIEIKNAATLQKIGKEDNLPINGTYKQNNPIHLNDTKFKSIGTKDQPFLGTYDGDGHSISGLKSCLFESVSSAGLVKNVVITDSTMKVSGRRGGLKHRGFVACEAKESASLIDNRVAHSTINTKWYSGDVRKHPDMGVGGVVGHISGGVHISGSQVHNCTVKTAFMKEQVGLIAGIAEGNSTISNSKVSGSSVTVKDFGSRASAVVCKASGNVKIDSSSLADLTLKSFASVRNSGGVVASATDNAAITNTVASNVSISTRDYAEAGVVVGVANGNVTVSNSKVGGSTVNTDGTSSHAGVVVGAANGNATVSNSKVGGSTVNTFGTSAHAGVVVGMANGNVTVSNSKVDNSSVNTFGRKSHAGITAGSASGSVMLTSTTATGCTVTTNRNYPRYHSSKSDGGIGLGSGSGNVIVNGTFAEKCTVLSNSKSEYVGDVAIGVGAAEGNVQIINTHAVNCTVSANRDSGGGGGAGRIMDNVHVVNTVTDHLVVSASGEHTINGFGALGFGAGIADGDASIKSTSATDSDLISNGNCSYIGGGAGLLRMDAKVNHTTLKNCNLETRGIGSDAGGGAGNIGDNAQVDNTVVNFSNITTTARDSDAGFAVGEASGEASITNTSVKNSTVQSYDANGNAGGAGELTDNAVLKNIQVQGSTIIAKGDNAHAAAGAGFAGKDSRVEGVLSQSTHIKTLGSNSHSAVGVGKTSGSAKVENIRAICTHVEAKGELSSASVGAGIVEETSQVSNVYACLGSVSIPVDGYGNPDVVACLDTFSSLKKDSLCDVEINSQRVDQHCEPGRCNAKAPQGQALKDMPPLPQINGQHETVTAQKSQVKFTRNPLEPNEYVKENTKSYVSHVKHEQLHETQSFSMGVPIGAAIIGTIVIGGSAAYGLINVVRGIKDGKTGWALAKAPFFYAVNDLRSCCGSTNAAPPDDSDQIAGSRVCLVQKTEKDSVTGLALAKAPFTYAASHIRSCCGSTNAAPPDDSDQHQLTESTV